jgi:hypothetical protein
MPPLPDRFETIRDCRSLFLTHLGVLFQNSGQFSALAIQAIQEGAGAYFDGMVESNRRGSFKEEADGLTSSSITLVCEHDLELGIRLDNLSARLFETSVGDLWKIHLRFATLLQRPDLAKTSIPVGPKGICQGLDKMFAAAGALGIDRKLQQLDGIEASLQENLPALYAEINAFLDRAGIEAAQPVIVSSPENPRRAAPETSSTPTNAPLALQQALRSRLPGPRQGSLQAGNPAALPLSQAAIERLTFRLDERERHGSFAAQVRPDNSPSLETLIPGLFSEGETSAPVEPQALDSAVLGIPASAPEAIAIDTLAKIFAAITDDPSLPDALKAVISSLHITLLKRAIQDPGLFSNTAHPARLLLDRMALAMLGLPVDVPAQHPVCARLAEIAGQLRSRPTVDNTVLDQSRVQVDRLIAERTAGIVSTAQAFIPLLQQLDRRDQAIIQSRQAVDKLIERGIPTPVRDFLDNVWSRVLQQVWLEYGQSSSQWQEHTAVIVNLLWTFQPKSSIEERNVLARRLPEILKQLKSGMDRVGVAAETQAAFLDACFSLQTESLRTTLGSSASVDARPLETAGVLRPSSVKPVVGEVESGQLFLRTLDFSGIRPPPPRPLPCQTGDWLEIRPDGEPIQAALLCYISPNSQRVLLCGTDGKPALSIHPAILDQQFREDQARVLGSLSLFDTAAKRALQHTMAA